MLTFHQIQQAIRDFDRRLRAIETTLKINPRAAIAQAQSKTVPQAPSADTPVASDSEAAPTTAEKKVPRRVTRKPTQ